jgi:uncharacterized protein
MKAEKRSFQCRRCGACCRWPGHVLLTDTDISRLAGTLNLNEDRFIGQYTVLASNRRQLSLAEHEDGRCVFLANDACAVYDARPEQCRNFPHTWRVTAGCPALDALKEE